MAKSVIKDDPELEQEYEKATEQKYNTVTVEVEANEQYEKIMKDVQDVLEGKGKGVKNAAGGNIGQVAEAVGDANGQLEGGQLGGDSAKPAGQNSIVDQLGVALDGISGNNDPNAKPGEEGEATGLGIGPVQPGQKPGNTDILDKDGKMMGHGITGVGEDGLGADGKGGPKDKGGAGLLTGMAADNPINGGVGEKAKGVLGENGQGGGLGGALGSGGKGGSGASGGEGGASGMAGGMGNPKDKLKDEAIGKADGAVASLIPDKITDGKTPAEEKQEKKEEQDAKDGKPPEPKIEAGVGKKKEANMTKEEKKEAIENGGESQEDSSSKKAIRTAGRGVAAYFTGGSSLGKDQKIVKSKTGDKILGVVSDELDKHAPGFEQANKELDDSGGLDAVEGVMDVIGSAKNKDPEGVAEGAKKIKKGVKKGIKWGLKKLLGIILLALIPILIIFLIVLVIAKEMGVDLDLTGSGDPPTKIVSQTEPITQYVDPETGIYDPLNPENPGLIGVGNCACPNGCGWVDVDVMKDLVIQRKSWSDETYLHVLWKRKPDYDVRTSGCSLLAVVNSCNMLGIQTSVEELANWTYNVKKLEYAGWGSGQSIYALADHLNLEVIPLFDNKQRAKITNFQAKDKETKINLVKQALASGLAVIASGANDENSPTHGACTKGSGNCTFTAGGHFVAVVAATADGKFIVANSMESRSATKWTLPQEGVVEDMDIAAAVGPKGSQLIDCSTGTVPGEEGEEGEGTQPGTQTPHTGTHTGTQTGTKTTTTTTKQTGTGTDTGGKVGVLSSSGYYAQGKFPDTVWRGDGSTIKRSGCSLIAVANAAKYLGVAGNSPTTIASWSKSHVANDNATGWNGSVKSIISHLGLKWNGSYIWSDYKTSTSTKLSALRSALASGCAVIAGGDRKGKNNPYPMDITCDGNVSLQKEGKCVWSPNGHFAIILGVSKDNKITVANASVGYNGTSATEGLPYEYILKYSNKAIKVCK